MESNINEDSITQEASYSQSQELTQLYENDISSPICIEEETSSPLNLPWGRLIPCLRNFEAIGQPQISKNSPNTKNGGGFDLFPRNSSSDTKSSQRNQPDKTLFLGLEDIHPGDRFNEYIIGRSQRCDIISLKYKTLPLSPGIPQMPLTNQPITPKVSDWVHSLISNRHCCIYCMIENRSNSDEREQSMEVYVEDTSGNGTIINQTTLLRRGEKRLLHTGDEICLINPTTVRKHIRITEHQLTIIQNYTFVFINMHRQHRLGGRLVLGTSPVANAQSTINQSKYPSLQLSTRWKGHVDVRATNSKSPSSVKRMYENNSNNNSNSNLTQTCKVSSPSQNLLSTNMKQTNQKNISPAALPLTINARSNATNMRNEQHLNLPYQNTKPRRIDEHYDLRNLLGSGTCGEVRRAIHRQTGKERAVKIISLSANGHKYMFARMKETEKTLKAEASILQSLNHPYIVKLIDLFVSSTAVYLVMEMLQGGDLFDRIIETGCYTEKESRQTMRRILSAVHYLHEDRDVVHRDLKPENILCMNKSSNIDVKLTDFGLAKIMTDDGLKTFCGTPLYFAPEVLLRRNSINGEGRYGKEADMWSLGVILYILLSGTPPFNPSIDVNTVVNAKIEFIGSQWERVSWEAKKLILLLLQTDPKKRIDIKGACNHKWILIDDDDTHIHPLDDPVLQSSKSSCKSDGPKSFDRNAEKQLKDNIILKAPPQSSPSPFSKSIPMIKDSKTCLSDSNVNKNFNAENDHKYGLKGTKLSFESTSSNDETNVNQPSTKDVEISENKEFTSVIDAKGGKRKPEISQTSGEKSKSCTHQKIKLNYSSEVAENATFPLEASIDCTFEKNDLESQSNNIKKRKTEKNDFADLKLSKLMETSKEAHISTLKYVKDGQTTLSNWLQKNK